MDELADSPEAATRSEVSHLKSELARQHDQYLRVLADFDNYRRRTERERASAVLAGRRDLLLSLLGVLDNFDYAFSHMKDAAPGVIEGMKAIQRQLLSILESEGVSPFESVGRPFDPHLHEAVASEPSSEVAGTVIDELRRGYKWRDEVLRPAQVRVAR